MKRFLKITAAVMAVACGGRSRFSDCDFVKERQKH